MALGTLDALAMVNPYMSARRQFICEQLAYALPNTTQTLASNDKGTAAKFQEWTGQTQASLESHWATEGFTEGATGSWTRVGGGPVTTSCEGLINTMWRKIEEAGFGKRRGGATSFNLAGNVNGKEVGKAPVGWKWWRDKADHGAPQPGDMFQIGTETGPGQWYHHHVGIITFWTDGLHPMWETVEAGQGGPLRGYDFMARKEYRLVFPISTKEPRKQIMGWLDMDEYFSDGGVA